MPSGFSGEFKELVRSRTDLVALARESIGLTAIAGGREFKGLCPFHDDHNPSMCIYPDRQTYRCWSCNEGGDCFSWVQKIEGVDFSGALESLAQRANLELPKRAGRGTSGEADQRKRAYEALAWAAQQLHQCLLENREAQPARDYLKERGFSAETIQRFRLGYHPDAWQWLTDRARRKFTEAELAAAGIIKERNSGQGYVVHQCFRGRLVFPICDERGRTVAFGGRVLPGSSQQNVGKYINSSENPLFAKNRVVYGFDVARDQIRRSEAAIVMEGYTDCILAHQHDVKNAVATLGTALTENHVTLLKRFARQVVLVFDSDTAGIQAAERSVQKFLAQDVDLRILTLPAGLDPADYLQKHDTAEFQQLVAESPEAWEFKLKLAAERHGLESIDGRERLLEEMLQLVAQAPRLTGTSREDLILNKLAGRLGLAEARIRPRLREIRQNNRSPFAASGDNTHRIDRDVRKVEAVLSVRSTSRDDIIEADLLEIVFAAPERFDAIRQEIGPDDFRNPQLRCLFETCLALAETGMVPAFDTVLTNLEDPEEKRLAVRLETQSRQKNVLQKLAGAAGDQVELCLLQETLGNVKWRREECSHERVKQQLGIQPAASSDSDTQTQELLRHSMEYHRKRATKKTSIRNL